MTTPVLAIRDLAISLPRGADRDYAVQNIDFDLNSGEILCVVGESGSGKSMTANALMGLLPDQVEVAKGSAEFEGRDLLALPDNERRKLRGARIGMIFQEPMTALNPLMRIGDQIAEVFEAHNLHSTSERREKALALIREVGLPDPEKIIRAYPFQLSGGQRQRAMIAMALALDPAILIADEPTTALDVTTQAQILDLIKSIQSKHGMAVMFITHDFGVVAEIADRVIVMRYGEIVEQGPAKEVLENPQHSYTKALLEAIPSDHVPEPTPITEQPVLEVRNLCKTFVTSGGLFKPKRSVTAIDNISFTIAKGEVLGIVGESGSGKSTVGRAIVRLVEADSGEIILDGKDMNSLTTEELRSARRRVQMIFQDPYASLNPRKKILHALSEGPIVQGVAKEKAHARARELLEIVELDAGAADRYPHEFSGGQRQRIGIARALAMDPDLIIADEAVSALDVSIQAQVLELLRDLQTRLHLSLMFITHDMRVAAQLCDRVAVMQKGQLVEIGPVSEVFLKPQKDYTRSLLAAVPGTDWQIGSAKAG
ncbi:ABC transporter ATP-binding protein [Roseovarius indicus]|uniref:Glutathione import ATP-binding protein GsiA n=1 Tax=Roseovarius indicus TaxID=540747 RepID=A0A0T5P4W0_9RHOB|nr:ABC transporter ATP-binding protein [Roseovarius indicus]KRS16163.1 microcin ABC transporter ATP-binding protein [Roseovarius indicus]QEW25004.1 Glutathione import ATP-binding protein GsiA [Roseovarius indicus]SFE40285.1 peptide/nickel transport system ATP-binding protein [Roseovarius indicus]